MAAIETVLKKHDLKVTRTRVAVYTVLEKATYPLSAEEIFDQVREIEQISLATVYRTLNQFTEVGITLKDTPIEGSTQYQLAALGHKHYLRCSVCNERIQLTECPIKPLAEEIAEKTGYVITGHSLEIVGVCPACQKLR